MHKYPNLVFCTLPQEIDGDFYIDGIEFDNGMYEAGAYMFSQGALQGIAPLYVADSIEKCLQWLDSLQAPRAKDLAYLASL